MSEDTPLLASHLDAKLDPYSRFSKRRKMAIVAMVSWSGLLPLFVSGCFVPSIPQIAKDLNTTGSVVKRVIFIQWCSFMTKNLFSLAVSLSILTTSVSNMLWATYSGFYGRRIIYLSSLPILCLGSIGVASAQSVPQLMIFRIVQAFGGSAGMSVGSAVVADIYSLEERGTAMGIFFAACLLGPALAPFAGGAATHYFTWRHMHIALLIAGLVSFYMILFFLPETMSPGCSGLDKLCEERPDLRSKRWVWVWKNPLKCLWLLRSPNIMAVTLSGTATLLSDYVLLIPLAYTIGARYNITNEALIGAFFLPAGLGNMVGAPIAGRLSDNMVTKWRKRRNAEWVPEDRLRATLFGAGVMVPLSVLLSGFVTQWVPGTPGIAANLLLLFVNGLGVDFVLSPSAAYNVDVLHSRSAEIMAANNGFRGVILALATSVILPSIQTIGLVATNAISATLAWIGFGLLYATVRYGDRMRAWVDVGFSTAADT